jgi:calcium-dependent protein kinase
MMLSGRLPFTGLNDLETIKKIVKLEYTFNFDEWNKISQPAKNLIKRIFVNDEERLTSQEVLNSEWVTQLGPDGDAELLSIHIVDVNLYTRLNKIHKFVINYICFRLKEEGTKELIKIFKSIDKNSDGVITLSEFKESISKVCFKNAIDIEENFIHNLYIEIDIDKNGLINYNEFISSLLNYKSMKNPERLYESFRTLDLEKNGRLTLSSVLSAIRPQTREDVETIEKCFKKYDLNKDGFIDFEEFIKALELGELENLEQYKALLY